MRSRHTPHGYPTLPNSLLVPSHVAFAQRSRTPRPRAVDLFAGCGGMSLGLIEAGWEVLAGADHWTDAAHTYMHNLGAYPCRFKFTEDKDRDSMERTLAKSFQPGENGMAVIKTAGSGWRAHNPDAPGVPWFFLGDIRKLRGEVLLKTLGLDRGELDLISGGPPCQGFSTGGKRQVMDPRNSLIFEFARLIIEINPKMIIMENVPGIMDMMTPEGVPVIDVFCRILEDGGFGGVDALYRSIEAQTGQVGLMRSKKRSDTEELPNNQQRGLFDD